MSEPRPKRRSAWRHATGGLMLCGFVAANLWLVERAGWTNWREWWRETWVQLRGGSHSLREKVQLGMTREEVKRNLWGEPEQPWSNTVISIRTPDCDSGLLPRYLAYPCPFARVDYPEYGFTVIYHGKPDEPKNEWKVVAVEDRK